MSNNTPPNNNQKPKIVISAADIANSETSAVVSQIEAAKLVPLVRNVGTESSNRGSWSAILWFSLAGIGGGFLTWIVWQVLPYSDDTTIVNLQTSVSIALAIGFVLVAVDSGLTRSWPKVGKAFAIAAPSGLVLSLVLGLVANALYSSLVEQTVTRLLESGFDPSNSTFFEEFANQNHLNRGLAWSLMGLAAGLTVGVTSLAIKRVLVAAAGGFVGGFLGGFLFDFFQGESEAQIFGLVVTGVAIGISIGLMEQATKSSWLEITRGGMAGKQFILYKNDITLGSSPTADVTLIKDPAIPGVAATLSRRGSQTYVTSFDTSRPISVDGVAIIKGVISDGATIELGSTAVRFRERSKSEVKSGVVRA
jgi:hypothetical protein